MLRCLRPNSSFVAALFVLIAVGSAIPAAAVEPGEQLSDTALEARARAISSQLRCLVCQNQSIDDSNAPLAKDLRVLVRDRLKTGDSDAAVKDFIVARYGDFVLLRPPFNAHTLLLWLAPILALVGLAYALWRSSGRFDRAALQSVAAPLSDAEEKKLRDLLDKP